MKKDKMIVLTEKKIAFFSETVKNVKAETTYRGFSFSKMTDIGMQIVAEAYEKATDEEKKEITEEEDFREFIKNKIQIK